MNLLFAPEYPGKNEQVDLWVILTVICKLTCSKNISMKPPLSTLTATSSASSSSLCACKEMKKKCHDQMISAKRDKTEKNTQRRKQNRISVKEKLITMLKKKQQKCSLLSRYIGT